MFGKKHSFKSTNTSSQQLSRIRKRNSHTYNKMNQPIMQCYLYCEENNIFILKYVTYAAFSF